MCLIIFTLLVKASEAAKFDQNLSILVYGLDKLSWNSGLGASVHRKGMNPSLLSSALCKIEQTKLFSQGMDTSLRDEKLWQEDRQYQMNYDHAGSIYNIFPFNYLIIYISKWMTKLTNSQYEISCGRSNLSQSLWR